MRRDRKIGLLAIAAVTGCVPSPSEPVDCEAPPPREEASIRAINCTDAGIIAIAVDEESLPLIMPVNHLEVQPGDPRVILSGESRLYRGENIGYERGEGLGFFIYEVKGDRAPLKSAPILSPKQLQEDQFRVRIRWPKEQGS